MYACKNFFGEKIREVGGMETEKKRRKQERCGHRHRFQENIFYAPATHNNAYPHLSIYPCLVCCCFSDFWMGRVTYYATGFSCISQWAIICIMPEPDFHMYCMLHNKVYVYRNLW